MFEEIARRIHQAAVENHKVAMLHFQVLKNAKALETADAVVRAVEFCRLVRIPASYATEFRKMLSLARLMEEQGVRLV